MTNQNEHIRLELPANLKFLHLAVATGVEAARCAAAGAGVEEQDVFVNAVELALSEIFTNAVKHGDKATSVRSVVILLSVGAGVIEVIVSDHNPPYDLDSVRLPDIDALPEGGYGLYLVKQVMDSATVRRVGDGNVLTMTKAVSLEDVS